MPAQLALLHSNQASLVLECRNDGPPLWRHLGARVEPLGLAPLAQGRTPASFSLDEDVPFSTAPPSGLGWFELAAWHMGLHSAWRAYQFLLAPSYMHLVNEKAKPVPVWLAGRQ